MFVKMMFVIAMVTASMLSAEKVLIFTYSYNRPDFIEIQYKTFKKFLKDDYEYIVYNDASNDKDRKKIEATCAALNIPCINIPQEIHTKPYLKRFRGDNWNNPSVRNCNVVQFSLDTLGFKHKGIVALFDSDLFLVKDFSIKKFLKGYDLSAYMTGRKKKNGEPIDYLWIGLVFLNMAKMPNHKTINFNCGKIDGVSVDSGGFSHYYLKDNPKATIRSINRVCDPLFLCPLCKQNKASCCIHNTQELQSAGFDAHQMALIRTGVHNLQFFHNACFFHYSAGSNWNKQSKEYHDQKTKILNDYINSILKD